MSDDSEKPKSKSATAIAVMVIAIGAIMGGSIGGDIGREARRMTSRLFTPSSEILTQIVKDMKSNMRLPSQVDEITTLTDVQADVEQMAIVYYMNIAAAAGNDENQIRAALKENVMKMCAPKNSEAAFKEGIHFKWNYHFVDDNKNITVTVKKEDC